MQLRYRGQAYNFQSMPNRSNQIAGTLPRNLQYRGNAYTFHMVEPQGLPAPQAINWRYEVQ
ncbi:DUF4278 domain-containing protein [Kovacikia minuta CCNUW1]|uniref:DUF4278 domain-containing protein n=1 Tax=Kovacikia minuta TaxID=2931930 RepID=UPI001CCEB7C1|nr:DUF4278 domain-containing protein [Kovacikia minuta]UBF24146.1 DUF4278 domain-containing protein [Kovacikia minuta CCNUW1]